MTANALEFYVAGDSWLHRLDSRVKLAALTLAGVTLFFWINLPLAGALLLIHVVLLTAGYPWSGWRRPGGQSRCC